MSQGFVLLKSWLSGSQTQHYITLSHILGTLFPFKFVFIFSDYI